MIRTKRKINKLRGSRSNGGGCTKKGEELVIKGAKVKLEVRSIIGLGLLNLILNIMVNMVSKGINLLLIRLILLI